VNAADGLTPNVTLARAHVRQSAGQATANDSSVHCSHAVATELPLAMGGRRASTTANEIILSIVIIDIVQSYRGKL
jgi:hypothetical protein